MRGVTAIYHVRAEAGSIEERARAIAIEQSVEMPVSAIEDEFVVAEIVGQVAGIRELGEGLFEVSIELAGETLRDDAGQLMNMLFGNTSLHEDVVLHDVEFSSELACNFAGPGHGPRGLKRRAGAGNRALTCSALKPQGLSPERLADLARRFADGGIDFVKDDHGLADQPYSPFAKRIERIATALDPVPARYIPSLSGDLDSMRRQAALAKAAGIGIVMVAPMIAGLSNVSTLVRENPELAFMAHPTLGGAARIAPPLLLGKLFRLIGMDAVVFPNHGGRFSYSANTCREIARACLAYREAMRPAMPVPAGGMTLARVPEILDFYGPDIMLLIGGGLLAARERLSEETASFVAAVSNHGYG